MADYIVDIDTKAKDLQVQNYGVAERVKRSTLQLDSQRTPVTLEWKDIRYSVLIKDPTAGRCSNTKIRKEILKGMSGSATPGTCIAIMGPSGSGKTTLLNALAGRITADTGSKLEGTIKVNGVDRTSLGSRFARISSYVQQDDVLFSLQTVRETLLNAAKLRLPKEVSLNEKNERVDALIAELGLSKAEHTHIGDHKVRGVSGGERKRTNIGVELVQDPSLLFLDEPTSGLDSFQALNVIETLKILCHHGSTVVLSIHQPRSSIFAMFDHLILLSEGFVVYDGPPGQQSVDYFANLGFQCPDLFNPADYFLDIVSVDNRSYDEEQRSRRRIEYLIDAFNAKQAAFAKENNDVILEDFDNRELNELNKMNEMKQDSKAPKPSNVSMKAIQSGIWTQIQVLGTRNFRQLSRDKSTLIIRLCTTCFFGLLIAALYSEMGSGQKSIQDRIGVLFFVTINQSFGALFNTINTFVEEKPIVMRERQSFSFHLSAYYITKVLTAMPIDIMTPLLFSCIVYWIVGLNPDPEAFLIFCGITLSVTLGAIGIGFCVGSKAPSVKAASAMGPPVMILQLMFAGFYLNISNIPVWLRWISNLSVIQWAFGAYILNEFTGKTFDCDDISGTDGCTETGEQVIELLSFEDHVLWENFLYLFALTIGFHALAFTILSLGGIKYMQVTQSTSAVENEDDVELELKVKDRPSTLEYESGPSDKSEPSRGL